MKPQAFGFNTSSRNLANLPKPGGFPVKYGCPSCGKEFCEFCKDKTLVGSENLVGHNCNFIEGSTPCATAFNRMVRKY